MASIKELKKDIHYVTTQLVLECFIADIYLNEEKESQLSELAQQVLEKKTGLIKKINEYRVVKNEVKASEYFKKVHDDFHELIKNILDEINKLAKQK